VVLSGRWAGVAGGRPPAAETPADGEGAENGCRGAGGGRGSGRRGDGCCCCCCCWEPDVLEEEKQSGFFRSNSNFDLKSVKKTRTNAYQSE